MECVKCSVCHRKFDDTTLLSLHHEYEICFDINSSSLPEANFSCPLCNKRCYDPLVLQIHVNEVHDQVPVQISESQPPPPTAAATSDSLYAQDLERRERMKRQYEQQATSEVCVEQWQEDEDAHIARMLQEEENAQSFEEFQNRHGGSTRTFAERARWNLDKIYKNKSISQAKYEEYKMKLDEMIAQPIETTESRSTDIIPMISKLPMGNILDRRLCRPGCDHISATWLDQGWACGYKNFQMLLSSLRSDPQYSMHLFGHDVSNQVNRDIPSVSFLQKLIEKAWTAGFDSDGRQQFNNHLVNSTKWIGPTEIMACLGHLNIKTELFDFHQPKNIEKSIAYKYLFEWVRKYFQQQQQQQENKNNNIIHPLYLQHEGHSRTIVGYEQFRDGNIRLLIFDPSTPKYKVEKFCKNPYSEAYIFRRNLHSFQKPVYQILAVRGLIQSDEREASKRVRSIKVPLPSAR
ncbi:unnamed protein product [Rotaria socialis]|uniref:WW domain-containing protein n=3 Tax=Rotaria socialis TaxID=392032 RepID=A0A818DLP3_9BILA|nr:unnamed protein product [Rotaria socialis]CAF3449607.1 unnamed protein product [Rotaria socialis]CAF3566421.1 unnamed protein product [Rotaria socialis]